MTTFTRALAEKFWGERGDSSNQIFIILAVLRRSGSTHIRGLASGQHSSEETSQLWRVVGDTVSDLTGPRIEPQTSQTR